MKPLLNVCCAVSVAFLLYLGAGYPASPALTDVTGYAGSGVARSSMPAVFNACDRTKVVH